MEAEHFSGEEVRRLISLSVTLLNFLPWPPGLLSNLDPTSNGKKVLAKPLAAADLLHGEVSPAYDKI